MLAPLAPLAPVGRALVLPAAAPGDRLERHGFDYGWVRGAGSGAFILGSILSGQAVGLIGLGAAIWLNAALLIAAALWAPWVLPLSSHRTDSDTPVPPAAGHIGALLRLPAFRGWVLVAPLILGSHAMHDGFAMIRWRAAGIAPGTAGLLWSEAVAAEVVVFLVIGRPLLDRLRPNGAAVLAAAGGVRRGDGVGR